MTKLKKRQRKVLTPGYEGKRDAERAMRLLGEAAGLILAEECDAAYKEGHEAGFDSGYQAALRDAKNRVKEEWA